MSERSFEGHTVLLLTSGGFNPWMIANRLARRFPGLRVLQEPPESKMLLLKRRVRRFGWINAIGQLATMTFSRFGKRFASGRMEQIARDHGLSGTLDAGIPVETVGSLNDPDVVARIVELKPSVVLTVSCRILSKATLDAIPCPVINLHCGINPAYRGQMGGYWSRVSGDPENFGATVHLVDAGIDTGGILHMIRTSPSPADSMWTYPTLLTAISADAMEKAAMDAIDGRLAPAEAGGPSGLWYNVPVWTWLYHGLTKGIW